ncbi:twin-arginine translocation signal domain-containing protein [Streptomyces sp. NPDC052036]|uniref:twin-arginine translocation signal domain-containing protein n=1 Tax=Streptomyces sp. NPDC052036 TaxID=3155171 RepID=UPI0034418576
MSTISRRSLLGYSGTTAAGAMPGGAAAAQPAQAAEAAEADAQTAASTDFAAGTLFSGTASLSGSDMGGELLT